MLFILFWWAYLVGPVYRGGYRLGLHYLILDDGLASLISVWALIVMEFGHRPDSHGASRPSAKYLWSSAVSVKSSKVSASRHESVKVLASRSLGQVSKGLGLLVSRPSLQKSRPLGLSTKSPKVSVRLTGASGSQVGPSLAQYRYSYITIHWCLSIHNCNW